MTCLLTDNALTQLLDQLNALVEGLADAPRPSTASRSSRQSMRSEQGLEGLGGVADLFSTDITELPGGYRQQPGLQPSDIAAASDQYTNLLGTLFAGGKAVVPQVGILLKPSIAPSPAAAHIPRRVASYQVSSTSSSASCRVWPTLLGARSVYCRARSLRSTQRSSTLRSRTTSSSRRRRTSREADPGHDQR